MANLLEWEKRLKQAVASQHKIGWSVREKRGKCLVQRYWKDTGTYENVLNRQQNRKLNEIKEILIEKDSGRSLIDISEN